MQEYRRHHHHRLGLQVRRRHQRLARGGQRRLRLRLYRRRHLDAPRRAAGPRRGAGPRDPHDDRGEMGRSLRRGSKARRHHHEQRHDHERARYPESGRRAARSDAGRGMVPPPRYAHRHPRWPQICSRIGTMPKSACDCAVLEARPHFVRRCARDDGVRSACAAPAPCARPRPACPPAPRTAPRPASSDIRRGP